MENISFIEMEKYNPGRTDSFISKVLFKFVIKVFDLFDS